MTEKHVLWTGLTGCYDENGDEIGCGNSGQDGAFRRGEPWPSPRFLLRGDELVLDRLTDLTWARRATAVDYPLDWQESLDAIAEMNRQKRFGRNDWRLPNRRELRSLIDHSARKPALPAGHPFLDVFLGWYWSSTTAAIAPGYAWYLHLEGGRMFYGHKDSTYWAWPVCGQGTVLAATGQRRCHDREGRVCSCTGTGQDGELQYGQQWDRFRFTVLEDGILDTLTGLVWGKAADLAASPVSWQQALEAVVAYSAETGRSWRLPTINELESLVDADSCNPALPGGHPFTGVQEAYWSSTTSGFEKDWAYVLYLHKGAVGVGHKAQPVFAVWPVRE